ncbi:2OG-Fe(II) oxygenase [Phenylobacterium sp.]|uniref:2OG-Fe(II) oxygenase n=1 Tax=Phenylobacterium sp. TaxID=1871053 RepID=UPI002DE45F80|nr:2OG-Fe(II) oxygenase [Phenylobacterium sp.]
MTIAPGTPAPQFRAPSPVNPAFEFASLGGRLILLVFLPEPSPERAACLDRIAARRELFRDDNAVVFGVDPDPVSYAAATDTPNGLRWFSDASGEVRRLYHVEAPRWFLIDPSLRVIDHGPLDQVDAALEAIARIGDADRHAGVPVTAPVLLVPRVLEPAFCRELIEAYDADGGAPSGVMHTVEGKFVGLFDRQKKRRDAQIPEGPLREGLRARLGRRLVPEIKRAFQFEVSRIERYIVACYDAEEGGFFKPHIDNGAPQTAHRKFAVTINLNGDFEGGDLRFPEFGRRTYRAPAGGAVVFSCSLLHEATPVTAGRRYATLPFLYDEAGQRLREDNARIEAEAAQSRA